MSRDFDYFTEFLADPSKYEFDEFHRWVKEWGRYIIDHKDEFNYLEDDEWKEIRERLLEVLYAREHEMDEVEDEWDEIGEMLETAGKFTHRERLKLYERQLQFMKDYKYYFDFKEEDIIAMGKQLKRLVESTRNVELSHLRLELKKADYNKSIAELDDELAKYIERTGKTPRITAHQPIKKHRGN